MRVTGELDAGTVWANQYGTSPRFPSLLLLNFLTYRSACSGILHSSVPFGGMRQSGLGRELGRAGIYEYCNVKSVHHNISEEMQVFLAPSPSSRRTDRLVSSFSLQVLASVEWLRLELCSTC
jgi:hypothetical protein